MKKIILFLGLGLFSAANIVAQEPAVKAAENKNAPIIVFDKIVYDFGTIAYDSNGAFEFGFKNEGNEPLIVSNVQKSCGCTSVDWTKEPIKKGGKGVIKVSYDTKRVGAFTKNVTVNSNAKMPSVVLTFKGTVLAAPVAPELTMPAPTTAAPVAK